MKKRIINLIGIVFTIWYVWFLVVKFNLIDSQKHTIESIDIAIESIGTWAINNTWNTISWGIDIDLKSDTCDQIGNGYKSVDVFKEPKKSPADFNAYKSYANSFTISWYINKAYVCIITDVVERRKNDRYKYSLYVLFNDSKYAWHINVGYSQNNWVMYDYTSRGANSKLDWIFWWSDTPKRYILDLNDLTVADTKNIDSVYDYTTIKPLTRLQQEWQIRIWWFVNAKNWEGIIRKFVIFYSGWDITQLDN